MNVSGRPKEASIEAVIIRADGTKVPLGVISYWHRNPLMRLWFYIRQNWGFK
jgi:hypothetical protein